MVALCATLKLHMDPITVLLEVTIGPAAGCDSRSYTGPAIRWLYSQFTRSILLSRL